MSRHDDAGADLPPQALTVEQVVDDVAAVLDDARAGAAVIYGTSYGTYIAAGVGVRHPDRVHAMILDSPLLCRHDMAAVRAALRGLLWDGDGPEAAALAAKVRKLTAAGVDEPGRRTGRDNVVRLRRRNAAGTSTRPAAARADEIVARAVQNRPAGHPQGAVPLRSGPGCPHRFPRVGLCR